MGIVKITLYTTSSGKEPFTEWLKKLDKTVRSVVLQRLTRLRVGNFGDCKFLAEGVWELRIHYGSGYRIYFGKTNDTMVILLLGGDKGSQERDINKAIVHWRAYRELIDEKK